MPVAKGDVIDLITGQRLEAKLIDLAFTTETLHRAMGQNNARFHRIELCPVELIEPERRTLAHPLSLQGARQKSDTRNINRFRLEQQLKVASTLLHLPAEILTPPNPTGTTVIMVSRDRDHR